jgi:hypothetical protein
VSGKKYAEAIDVKKITQARRSRRGVLALLAEAFDAGVKAGPANKATKKATKKKEEFA